MASVKLCFQRYHINKFRNDPRGLHQEYRTHFNACLADFGAPESKRGRMVIEVDNQQKLAEQACKRFKLDLGKVAYVNCCQRYSGWASPGPPTPILRPLDPFEP